GARSAAGLPAPADPVPARRCRRRLAAAYRRCGRGGRRGFQHGRLALRPPPRPAWLAGGTRAVSRRLGGAGRDRRLVLARHGETARKGASMTLPYMEPLVPREPAERTIPEPPRRGEPGGPPCRICERSTAEPVWADEHWTLHPPRSGSLPGAVWVASR